MLVVVLVDFAHVVVRLGVGVLEHRKNGNVCLPTYGGLNSIKVVSWLGGGVCGRRGGLVVGTGWWWDGSDGARGCLWKEEGDSAPGSIFGRPMSAARSAADDSCSGKQPF